MLLHVSTALRQGYTLDVEVEVQLVDRIKSKLRIKSSIDNKLEKTTMKKLGLKRTIDAIFVAYNDQTLPCFIFDGDMVISAMMAAINSHWNKQAQVIYHVTSAQQNPLQLSLIEESMYKYFHTNPRTSKDGESIKNKRVLMFKRFAYFQAYMVLHFDDTNLRKLWKATAMDQMMHPNLILILTASTGAHTC
uniref:Uncharacterized protein n=1 Tax=Oryza glumipatula TaxID=40148 RepID=A0A0D9ZJE7_9ORYZ